jgi:putative transposase
MAIEKELLDRLLAGRDPTEVFATGGLVDDLKKALSERILSAELDEHLEGEREGGGNANRRNGASKKSVLTGTSKMTLSIPRDRAGTFDPKLIAKYQRRFPDFDDKIISMYARGMSVREIRGHLEDLYGIDVSPDLISAVTDAVLEEVAEWWVRPKVERRSMPAFPWSSLMRSGSRSGMRASSATRPSTSRSASWRTARRRFSASGSSKPRVPSSGCVS